MGGFNLCSPNYYREFQQFGQNSISIKSIIPEFQKRPLYDRNLGKTNIKHSTIRCRAELDIWTWCNRKPCRLQLDIGSGAMESLVDFISTLAMVQRKPLSTSTRHWTWCNGKRFPLQLDTGPGAMESAVDGQRGGGGRHSIPGCKTIAA